jgi:hypothetical protein
MHRRNVNVKLITALLIVSAFSGCSTVRSVTDTFTGSSVNFENLPEQELRALARQIEAEIAAGNREPDIRNGERIRVDDPRVVQAMRSRAARFELIDEFRSMGFSWERRNGRLWILKSRAYSEATTSQDRNRYAFLVYSENDDRWRLYESLIDSNNLPSNSLGAIQEIFFEARLEFMTQGQLYENSQGEPVELLSSLASE